MAVFGVTVFLSAFLLFQVQPMIAKSILPWYGSSPAVWTACMLFFQTVLLAGYSYAHITTTFLGRRVQAVVHLVLLMLAAATLPISPHAPTETPVGNPTWQILGVLARSVGFPYLLLSASGPLFQAWYTSCFPLRSHYRLYSLSNIGSLVALLGYPLVLEPTLSLGYQNLLWSCGFGVLLLSAAGCVWHLLRLSATAPELPRQAVEEVESRPTWGTMIQWFLYAATGTVLLLAITNEMCQDVAVVPLLWVLPLSVYLLSYILCFDSDFWYRRVLFLVITLAGSILLSLLLSRFIDLSIFQQIVLYVGLCFSACMCCHGELSRLRPPSTWSTLFYLTIAAGGAVGGLLVALVAPAIFLRYWELDLGLVAVCLLVWLAMVRDARPQAATQQPPQDQVPTRLGRAARRARRVASRATESGPRYSQGFVALVGIGVLSTQAFLGSHIFFEYGNILRLERNFYGVLTVALKGTSRHRNPQGEITTEADPEQLSMGLFHGRILHGFQFQLPSKRNIPNTYYNDRSGVGLVIRKHPARSTEPKRPIRLGVIGLGTGTLAAYAERGDYVRFYEINPAVVRIADSPQDGNADPVRFFSYLHDARERGATVEVSVGDARVLLDRSLKNELPEQFDVLAIDAFSGDAIPLHLCTQECLDIYLKHLAPDGVVAYHVSNMYLNLEPVVRRLAAERELFSTCVRTQPDEAAGIQGSRWVLLTRNQAIMDAAREWPEADQPVWNDRSGPLWTDDFSSIVSIVKW